MAEAWRKLTPNEINMARLVFSDGIDYARVKIYRGIPGLPPLKVAIAPNGHIYFPQNHCPPDFTQAGAAYRMWLIHELAHVWQRHNGFYPWLGGLLLTLCGGYWRRKGYVYPKLASIQNIGRLNLEQQADLIAHYYAAKYQPQSHYRSQLPQFERVLAAFLQQPRHKKLRPSYRPRVWSWLLAK